MTLRLLCDSNPMAYGSTASLVAIAPHLDADVVALGRDVSLELLRRWGGSQELLTVDVKDRSAVAACIAGRRFDAALVVSNLTNLPTYHALGLPVFFVDILFWYGTLKDEATWARFEQGFAVAFPGVQERVRELAWSRPPTIVGPLLRPLPEMTRGRRGTLVNVGGVRSPFQRPADVPAGLALVASILRAVEPELPDGVVLVAAGEDAARVLRPRLSRRFDVRPLAPAEYDDQLRHVRLCLTVPGLNAVFEAIAAETPIAFLPALNVSQCLQLERYERAGVVSEGLALTRHVPGLHLPTRVSDEGALTQDVLAALAVAEASALTRQRFSEHVRAQVAAASAEVGRRRAFLEALGAPGASTVAAAITSWGKATHA